MSSGFRVLDSELMTKKKIAVVTGSGGLIGSECARVLCQQGWHVVGIDNDMRRWFFGEAGAFALGHCVNDEIRQESMLTLLIHQPGLRRSSMRELIMLGRGGLRKFVREKS